MFGIKQDPTHRSTQGIGLSKPTFSGWFVGLNPRMNQLFRTQLLYLKRRNKVPLFLTSTPYLESYYSSTAQSAARVSAKNLISHPTGFNGKILSTPVLGFKQDENSRDVPLCIRVSHLNLLENFFCIILMISLSILKKLPIWKPIIWVIYLMKTILILIELSLYLQQYFNPTSLNTQVQDINLQNDKEQVVSNNKDPNDLSKTIVLLSFCIVGKFIIPYLFASLRSVSTSRIIILDLLFPIPYSLITLYFSNTLIHLTFSQEKLKEIDDKKLD
ncbi:hypothetical protein TBLA_0B07060 [Henningerozyma blattae CBS 6284]|uniref:Uncharacterized protein n=1 Tax=Henningerozyma blattae (strain ATCC 34711 / CBS 6284 / DSM 70876 / NBRC 10599 / NRRL Y-10934 / UCD 77-7) TaxID=1071380 RepID=I2GZH3_HENB6|nr:hypothetical protein TBLA_0B07060 [Tetrapisispora blattae CBS 6284]CCH59525.1 hypothetical protein TBLA_0B07060 [Tetrapisispora blattae CBS 6284]